MSIRHFYYSIKLLINIPAWILAGGGYFIGSLRIRQDIERWIELKQTNYKNKFIALVDLLTLHKEFRNIFFCRYPYMKFFKFICPPLPSLYINTECIGGGCFIQHGFSTVISAKRIGKNCWINQQVTIGHTRKGSPVIGDNVRIGAGAIVIGNITIGNNVTIGAGATVNFDVPDNTLVVPQRARVIENHILGNQ